MALTNAERQRRYIQRLKMASAAPPPPSVTASGPAAIPDPADCAAMQEQLHDALYGSQEVLAVSFRCFRSPYRVPWRGCAFGGNRDDERGNPAMNGTDVGTAQAHRLMVLETTMGAGRAKARRGQPRRERGSWIRRYAPTMMTFTWAPACPSTRRRSRDCECALVRQSATARRRSTCR
jgi:hypothetical protein